MIGMLEGKVVAVNGIGVGREIALLFVKEAAGVVF